MDRQGDDSQERSGDAPSQRDAQRALDAASSEPRTLAPEELGDTATELYQRETADQTGGLRTDPAEDRTAG